MSQYNRSRFRTAEKSGLSYLYYGTDGILYSVQWPISSIGSIEYINDAKSVKLAKGDTIRIKPVEHGRMDYHGVQVQPYFGDHSNVINYQNQNPWMDSTVLWGMMADISGSLIAQLSEEAFNSFSEQFPEKVSFSEFLLGLGKLQELLPKLSGDVLKDLASLRLSKSFGWDNLLSDLRALSSLVSEVQSRLEWLRKTYGKPTKLGFYKRDIDSATVRLQEHTWELDRGLAIRVVLRDCSADYRAGATLLQKLKHLDDMIGLVRGLTGALGLANPLKVVWVNLPFSFVVDWFARVSTHLDRVARVHPAEQWDVFNVSCSVRQRAVFDVFQINDDVVDSPENPVLHLGHITAERYVRFVGLPVNLGVYSLSNLSPSQLTLLSAMLT